MHGKLDGSRACFFSQLLKKKNAACRTLDAVKLLTVGKATGLDSGLLTDRETFREGRGAAAQSRRIWKEGERFSPV